MNYFCFKGKAYLYFMFLQRVLCECISGHLQGSSAQNTAKEKEWFPQETFGSCCSNELVARGTPASKGKHKYLYMSSAKTDYMYTESEDKLLHLNKNPKSNRILRKQEKATGNCLTALYCPSHHDCDSGIK